MKPFWITYVGATLALLAFCYSFLGELPVCAVVTVGAGLCSAWLFGKRKALAAQEHPILLAFIGSFISVASGFILVFAVGIIGQFLI